MEKNNLISEKNKKNLIYIQTELNTLIKHQKNTKIVFYILLILNIALIFIIINNKNQINFKIRQIIDQKFFNISIIISKVNETKNISINKINNKTEIINKKIIDEIINEQNYFCDNFDKYINKEIEEQIKLIHFEFNKVKYQIYSYKDNNDQKNTIIYNPMFKMQFNSILNDIKVFAEKNNISNYKNIYIIDIGGYIGYLGTIFGNYGYNILSFEPFDKNYYIYRKNYCQFNRNNTGIIIINKGIYDNEKKNNYYSKRDNIGNGMVLGNDIKDTKIRYAYEKISEVYTTRLNNYETYLSDKTIVLMIIDIQGSEAIAIESGIELIMKYHIPYIILNYNPTLLKIHGTDPDTLLQKLVNNGYKIYKNGKLLKNINNIDYGDKFDIILYLVYE